MLVTSTTVNEIFTRLQAEKLKSRGSERLAYGKKERRKRSSGTNNEAVD